MTQPYIGEIRIFAGNFAPSGWKFCDGSLLPVSENEVLFQLIGTSYGGDGQTTFALPDLRGRIPLHQGNDFVLAQSGGAETVTLTSNQIPSHNHALLASAEVANDPNPGGNVLGEQSATSHFHGGNPQAAMASGSVTPVGGGQPHDNVQPFLCVNFIISLFGIFPSQN
ncbi:phage tail protein [Wenzhouxiangella sp. AB-CW3]|uniref:phage tail protein n=1 Tax=Wenzhouxiangella sp. AB-CW3 TaxID=2771012 RepID=UPI00168A4BF0|nr:tail fiber protein [Wenzhouxiangella sp. AB-CW3]QOC22935.1 phage tail protein [Wenzhouxiangella sp. AB-CW3]